MEYGSYRIFHSGDGFQQVLLFGDSSMYEVTGFIVTSDTGEAYEFLFGLSTFEAALHDVHLRADELVEQALLVIKSRLDEGKLANGTQYAYQYYFDGAQLEFRPVDNPVWMTQSPR